MTWPTPEQRRRWVYDEDDVLIGVRCDACNRVCVAVSDGKCVDCTSEVVFPPPRWRVSYDRPYGRVSIKTPIGSLGIVVNRKPYTSAGRVTWRPRCAS